MNIIRVRVEEGTRQREGSFLLEGEGVGVPPCECFEGEFGIRARKPNELYGSPYGFTGGAHTAERTHDIL